MSISNFLFISYDLKMFSTITLMISYKIRLVNVNVTRQTYMDVAGTRIALQLVPFLMYLNWLRLLSVQNPPCPI